VVGVGPGVVLDAENAGARTSQVQARARMRGSEVQKLAGAYCREVCAVNLWEGREHRLGDQ